MSRRYYLPFLLLFSLFAMSGHVVGGTGAYQKEKISLDPKMSHSCVKKLRAGGVKRYVLIALGGVAVLTTIILFWYWRRSLPFLNRLFIDNKQYRDEVGEPSKNEDQLLGTLSSNEDSMVHKVYLPLHYAEVLYQVGKRGELSSGIMVKILKGSKMLRYYHNLWEKIHQPIAEQVAQRKGPEKDDEKRKLIITETEASLMGFNMALLQNDPIDFCFPDVTKERNPLNGLMSAEHHSSKLAIYNKVKKRLNHPEFNKYKKEVNKRIYGMLYAVSKKVYHHVKNYMSNLYDDMVKLIVEENIFHENDMKRQDAINMGCIVCRDKWEMIKEDIVATIPADILEDCWKSLDIQLERGYSIEGWATDCVKEDMEELEKRIAQVLTPFLISRHPEYVIDPTTTSFEPTDKMIRQDRAIYDVFTIQESAEEKKALASLKNANPGKSRKDYSTLSYYLLINLIQKDSGERFSKTQARFSLNRSLLGLPTEEGSS